MPTTLTHEAITQRAREIWESKGSPQGRDDEFWFEAEQQLQKPAGENHSRAPKNSSPGTISEAESDHAKNEQNAELRKEAMSPHTPHTTAPKPKPAIAKKPLWNAKA